MLKIRAFSCILFYIQLTKTTARLYSTSCETFDVKSDVPNEEEPYPVDDSDFPNEEELYPVDGFITHRELEWRQPSYPTLYSYAECRFATLNPGHKLHFYNENQKLKYIMFKHSNIPLIPVGVFPEFGTLMQLYLNDSNVGTIHPGAFNGLAKLEELYLQNNNITELTRGTLNSLSDLKILNISNNMLNIIEENALLGLFSLTHIDLSHNNLKNLSSTIFNGLSSVSFFDLSHNYIPEISPNLFANLSNRDSYPNSLIFSHNQVAGLLLDLSYNQLITIDFSYFPATLRNLNLANNHLNSSENLLNLPYLETLDLSNNLLIHIETIPSNLNYLNASGNKIHNLSTTLFHETHGLTIIDFSFNFITNLHEDSFQGLKNLRNLYLQNNMLDKLPIGCFRDLNLLILLNISSNRITEFEFGTFSGMFNLQILDISNNTLTDLFESTLHSLTSLQTLNINNNFLTTFDSNDLLKHISLKTVSLNNNPWNCKSLLNIITNFKNNRAEVLNGPAQKVRNIRGIPCLDYSLNNSKELNSFFEIPKTNQSLEKTVNLKEFETLRNFFNEEFLNSSFYKYFQNYNNYSFGANSSSNFLKYFDNDFKNTTFYKYFNQDLSNVTFFKSFNETLLRYSTAAHNIFDENLNTSLYKLSNSDSLSQSFSKYFEDGYKNSSFYKYFTKDFANSAFFKSFNEERQTAVNSTLIEIESELRSLRNFFNTEFKNSSFYQFFEQDYVNRNFNLTKFNYFVPNESFIGDSNSTPLFAKYVDSFDQHENQDILSKISDWQHGITVLMIIVIIILLCMMLLFALQKVSFPLKRNINSVVPINTGNECESTSVLELM